MLAHILVVEDDDTARMLLADALRDARYRVTTARDGEMAINLLTHEAFDLVLTDIRMGQIDGLQVLSAAKRREQPPAVIMLTGYASLETAVAALRSGADDYLLKPCEPTELLRCVTQAMRRRTEQLRQADGFHLIVQGIDQLRNRIACVQPNIARTAPDRYIQIGHLSIDCFRHTAVFDGQLLHLTPIEYNLLHCLGQAEGRVLSYGDIVRRTHGHHVDETEAQLLLKPHIRNLRRKLDPAYLVNVRGTGYMLAAPDQSRLN